MEEWACCPRSFRSSTRSIELNFPSAYADVGPFYDPKESPLGE
jgi:hypothetical protein